MAVNSSLRALKQALSKHGLLGSSIIPKTFDPSVFVTVEYELSGGLMIEPGQTAPIDATQSEPAVSFSAAEGKEAYTLALLDPDAPTRSDPKWGPFRHWLVSGVKPGTPARFEGETFTKYMGPAPPPGTGSHRYAFLLYREPAGSSPKFSGDKEDRKSYDIKSFVEENKLTLIGANFFLAENKSKE